jgi:hypothetical protein
LLSTTRKEYTARKKIHSLREGAKKGGHTQKRRGYIRRAKLDFEFLLSFDLFYLLSSFIRIYTVWLFDRQKKELLVSEQ